MSPVLTLSVGELLSESVGCDDQHPLDPPEQYDIITLQLVKRAGTNISFSHSDLIYNLNKSFKGLLLRVTH